MAFLDVHCFSDVLGLSISLHVLLPQSSTRQIGMAGGAVRGKSATLYLLHGLSDDHTIWMRRTSIERYATERNLAVVMPGAGRSFYQDMASGPKYWTFLSEELPALCERWFPISTAREDRFAAGLSMGGYGALRLGLACPGKFAAVASLSGALDLVRREREIGTTELSLDRTEWAGIFGTAPIARGNADLFALAERLAKSKAPRPRIHLSCGTEDYLLADTHAFKKHLDALGLVNTCDESPGTHEWGYWDRQIQRVLEWLPRRD